MVSEQHLFLSLILRSETLNNIYNVIIIVLVSILITLFNFSSKLLFVSASLDGHVGWQQPVGNLLFGSIRSSSDLWKKI